MMGNWGGYGYGMMDGWLGWLGSLTILVWLVVGILLIVWLWRQIQR